jgi:hypothetical protein
MDQHAGRQARDPPLRSLRGCGVVRPPELTRVSDGGRLAGARSKGANAKAGADVLTASAGTRCIRPSWSDREVADGASLNGRQEPHESCRSREGPVPPHVSRDLGAPVDRDVNLPKGVKGGSATKAGAGAFGVQALKKEKLQEGSGGWQRTGTRPGSGRTVRTHHGNNAL